MIKKLLLALLAIVVVPLSIATAEAGQPTSSETPEQDIVDTAVAAGSFDTLVAAVKAAGLVDALKGDGPLTVFAPSDEAFAKLPAGTVDSLLEPENLDKLKAILTYHVVGGKVMSGDLSDGLTANTLQGGAVSFQIDDRGARVENAQIVQADIGTSNGVIHVIDTVLMP